MVDEDEDDDDDSTLAIHRMDVRVLHCCVLPLLNSKNLLLEGFRDVKTGWRERRPTVVTRSFKRRHAIAASQIATN